MSYAAPTRTWGEVRQEVLRSFGDESGVQLEDDDLIRWINSGQYEICRQNKVLKLRGTQNAVPGQATYSLDLPRDIIQIESIRLGDVRLIPTEFTTIDANLDEYPADAKGSPKLWYKWGNEVTLWPGPKTTEALTIYFTGAPVRHPNYDPARLLEVPDEYYLPLVDFIMSKAHEMDDNSDSQQISTQLYAERMAAMNDEERAGQTLTFQTITIVD